MSTANIDHYIDGRVVAGTSSRAQGVFNPATGAVTGHVAQALQYGLVNHVDDNVDAKLQWLLERLPDQSPAAIRRGMYTLKKAQAMPFGEAMAFTESQIALFTLTDDAREGQLAFQEKRRPDCVGK